jgi:hypothetical protein
MIEILLAQTSETVGNPWIPVVSDAVKIGLGAFIAGSFAIAGAIVASRRKLRESSVVDRREQLRELGSRFERVNTHFRENATSLLARFEVESEFPEKDEGFAVTLDEAHALLKDRSLEALHELHEIEGRLGLLGLFMIAATVEAFRHLVTRISEFDDFKTLEDKQRFAKWYLTEMAEGRLLFVTQMATEYRKA